jgi:hypothetical protein
MCDSAEPDNFPDRRDLRAVCGGAMTRRKPSACSDRCRAAPDRRRAKEQAERTGGCARCGAPPRIALDNM